MSKKMGALLLAVIMMMSVSSLVFADPATLDGGEVGGFDTKDTPESQGKTIIIKKELTAYNLNEESINAPTISYTYTIAAGTSGISVTDETTDHNSGEAVTVPTKAGITTGVVMTGQGQETGTAIIAWAPTETLTASNDGTPNYKTLTIDFTNVVFTAAGVYRYTITETPPNPYAASGVTETDNTTNPHVRYLDVYVRRNPDSTGDGTAAGDWDIYGYVCLVESEAITPSGDTTTTGAVKTDGFVSGTNDSTKYTADSYYTYNVTVSKTVTNDEYAKNNHPFPFTVLFTNSNITKAVDISSKTTGTVSGYSDPSSGALTSGVTQGIVSIKDSSSVKYIGIPVGTTVEVYETNDVPGVVYLVTTTVDGTTTDTDDTVDVAVISDRTPSTPVSQSEKKAYQSTAASFTPTANIDDDVNHTIDVDNNLQVISPTGVALRVAPYVLILVAGVALLLVSRRRKAVVEE